VVVLGSSCNPKLFLDFDCFDVEFFLVDAYSCYETLTVDPNLELDLISFISSDSF